jgi:cobalt-zinc-cadmium efflux system protein
VVSLVVAAVIVAGTWGLFRESLDLALDAVPRGVEPEAIEAALAGLRGVAEVHDLHVWGASTSEHALTVHLVVPEAVDHARVLAAAGAVVRDELHVAHWTIQIADAGAGAACPQRPADML